MDIGALHSIYSISIVLILYQKFPSGMKSLEPDTIKSGRLPFDINFVLQDIDLITYWHNSRFKCLGQEFINFCHSVLF